jgi:hypothetical protein
MKNISSAIAIIAAVNTIAVAARDGSCTCLEAGSNLGQPALFFAAAQRASFT